MVRLSGTILLSEETRNEGGGIKVLNQDPAIL
jgi:hypothetical protein